MKLGIMQPYFFPYIGYFQLIRAVDKFVIYDDGKFRKYGWINRNRILLDGRDYMFTIPLAHSSPNTLIKDTYIHQNLYKFFKTKFMKQLKQSYGKAPFFNAVYELVKQVLESEDTLISLLAFNSIKSVCQYINLNTPFVDSSTIYQNSHLPAQERIIDICKKEGADTYINLPGGMELYDKKVFAEYGVNLFFIKSKPIIYQQTGNEFVPWLSIIDVLMFNSVNEVREMLDNYELL